MKILMISPDLNYPPIYGGRIRRYNLLKYLSRDNNITLLSFINSNEDLKNIEGIKKYCKDVETVQIGSYSRKDRWIARLRNHFLGNFFSYPPIVLHFCSREMKRRIKKLLTENDYDLVLIEYWYMGQYADFCKGMSKVLDEVDVEFVRWQQWAKIEEDSAKRQYALSLYRRVKRYETRVLKKFDKILTATLKDQEILKRYNPDLDIFVLPTCVDVSYFKPSGSDNDSKNLVFVGSMSAIFNADAILYFSKEIFPLILKKIPETHLYVVGLNPSQDIYNLANRNVTVTGSVEDVRPYVYKSCVFVVPLRFGSGIKGKVLEAMALGRPVITTSIGAQGLSVVSDEHLIIEDDPKEFAVKTIVLLNNKLLRQKLIQNGLKLVNERYTWEKIIPQLNSIFYNLVCQIRR